MFVMRLDLAFAAALGVGLNTTVPLNLAVVVNTNASHHASSMTIDIAIVLTLAKKNNSYDVSGHEIQKLRDCKSISSSGYFKVAL